MADFIALMIGYGFALAVGLGMVVLIISWLVHLFWSMISAV